LATLEETLEITRTTQEVKIDEMEQLNKDYQYKENAFRELTGMLNKYFPQLNVASDVLGTLAMEEKFKYLMREVQRAPIYSSFLNPLYPKAINDDSFSISQKVVFTKSFEICPENNPQTYMGELARLKEM
jgi:hypothetical protein